ncbi:MAG: PA2169 family four-helix-bundle protein [Tunicatimonas sp.]
MSDQNKAVVKSLHTLVQLNEESDRGYKEASENIDDPELKTILYRLSQQRAEFRGEIQEVLIKDYSDDETPSDSLLSKIHRGWMDFKTKLSPNDNEAVLDECVRGEKHAIETYNEEMATKFPKYIQEMLTKQLDLVRGALSQVQEFKASTKTA